MTDATTTLTRRARRPDRVAATAPELPAVHRPRPHRRAGHAAADGQRAQPGRPDQARRGDRGRLGAVHRGRRRGDERRLEPRGLGRDWRFEPGQTLASVLDRLRGGRPATPTSWSPRCPTSTPPIRCRRRRGSHRARAGRPGGSSCTSSPRPPSTPGTPTSCGSRSTARRRWAEVGQSPGPTLVQPSARARGPARWPPRPRPPARRRSGGAPRASARPRPRRPPVRPRPAGRRSVVDPRLQLVVPGGELLDLAALLVRAASGLLGRRARLVGGLPRLGQFPPALLLGARRFSSCSARRRSAAASSAGARRGLRAGRCGCGLPAAASGFGDRTSRRSGRVDRRPHAAVGHRRGQPPGQQRLARLRVGHRRPQRLLDLGRHRRAHRVTALVGQCPGLLGQRGDQLPPLDVQRLELVAGEVLLRLAGAGCRARRGSRSRPGARAPAGCRPRRRPTAWAARRCPWPAPCRRRPWPRPAGSLRSAMNSSGGTS